MSSEALSNKCFVMSKALNSLEIESISNGRKEKISSVQVFSNELHVTFVRAMDHPTASASRDLTLR